MKKVSVILILLALFVAGIIFYFFSTFQKKENTGIQQNNVVDFSKLNKDDLLQKLFPALTFKNQSADLGNKLEYPGLMLSLKDSVEDNFINPNEKSLLLITNLDGVPHVGGLYHAFLGLFDKNGNLLTSASKFPASNDPLDLSDDNTHFGGDEGFFGFYDCSGIKYIAFISRGCPNSTCCYDGAKLYRINNNEFEEIQVITQKDFNANYALKMTFQNEKLVVKKVPDLMSNEEDGCPETDYKTLNWNNKSCKFE